MDDPPALGAAPHPARALGGGVLMGLANLVPGVSGGTMILALGLYDRFIAAVADVTRLRWKLSSLVLLAWIGAGALAALLSLSGPAVALVTNQRWVMYSLFIGMTLGGSPLLVRQCRPAGAPVAAGFAAGVALMALLAWGVSTSGVEASPPMLVFIGALAASSMILPGISGSYMLLIFGLYDVVIGSLAFRALSEDTAASLRVLAPFVLGAVLGVALLSNVLGFLLRRFSAPSHAVLLGLLVGSVLGLWPFREPVHPELLDKARRTAIVRLAAGEGPASVNAGLGLSLTPEDAEALRAAWPGATPGSLKRSADELRRFRPRMSQVAAALGLFAAGFALTRALGGKARARR